MEYFLILLLLIWFLENFPSSLRQLIISGNPCVSDINAINNLQKALPQLEIITEEAEEEEEDENDEDDDDEEKAMESKNNSLPETLSNDIDTLSITSMNNIDPELVLREVVDRKCRLQSLVSAVSIETLTKVCSYERS